MWGSVLVMAFQWIRTKQKEGNQISGRVDSFHYHADGVEKCTTANYPFQQIETVVNLVHGFKKPRHNTIAGNLLGGIDGGAVRLARRRV